MKKMCSKCKILKDIDSFSKDKSKKDGYRSKCIICYSAYQKEYREKNKEKIANNQKEYRQKNKNKISIAQHSYRSTNKDKLSAYHKKYVESCKSVIKEYQKQYRKNNIDRIKEHDKQYRSENLDKIKAYRRQYYLLNKEKIRNHGRLYYDLNKDKIKNKTKEYRKFNKVRLREAKKKRLDINPEIKLAKILRCRIRMVLKVNNYKKCDSTFNLLGCSKQFFKDYIVSKFTKGMTLENHGINGWHLDHIKPCSSFDLSDPEQQKICFHYTNYQPLWATSEIAMAHGEPSGYVGNLEKSNKS